MFLPEGLLPNNRLVSILTDEEFSYNIYDIDIYIYIHASVAYELWRSFHPRW